MSTYYQQLGVLPGATADEIVKAHEQQRARYNPERLADMDDEMSRLATQRLAELDRVYAILADPQRRQQYDASIGLAPAVASAPAPTARRSLSSRERWYALGGGLAALLLIAVIWTLTGRSDAPQASPMAEVNRPAQPIALPALGGGTINLDDYRGKVVLLNFWGTWCEPCRRELPALQQAYSELRDQGFVVIGVNLTQSETKNGVSESEIATFLGQYGVTYPIALDVESSVTNAYRVFPLPTSFFVDGQGTVRFVKIGELTKEDVTATFLELQREADVPSR